LQIPKEKTQIPSILYSSDEERLQSEDEERSDYERQDTEREMSQMKSGVFKKEDNDMNLSLNEVI